MRNISMYAIIWSVLAIGSQVAVSAEISSGDFAKNYPAFKAMLGTWSGDFQFYNPDGSLKYKGTNVRTSQFEQGKVVVSNYAIREDSYATFAVFVGTPIGEGKLDFRLTRFEKDGVRVPLEMKPRVDRGFDKGSHVVLHSSDPATGMIQEFNVEKIFEGGHRVRSTIYKALDGSLSGYNLVYEKRILGSALPDKPNRQEDLPGAFADAFPTMSTMMGAWRSRRYAYDAQGNQTLTSLTHRQDLVQDNMLRVLTDWELEGEPALTIWQGVEVAGNEMKLILERYEVGGETRELAEKQVNGMVDHQSHVTFFSRYKSSDLFKRMTILRPISKGLRMRTTHHFGANGQHNGLNVVLETQD